VDQLREIVRIVDAVLGSAAVGVYLHGSSVLGGLRPASDLDLMVITRRTMSDRERAELLEEGVYLIKGDVFHELTGSELEELVATGARPYEVVAGLIDLGNDFSNAHCRPRNVNF